MINAQFCSQLVFLSSRIGRIAVVIPDPAPAEGAFSFAVDWAERLHLPVHGLFLRKNSCAAAGNGSQTREHASVCAGQRIAWSQEVLPWEGGRLPSAILSRSDLCLVDYEPIAAWQDKSLLASIREQSANLFVCPATYRPVTRAVIVVSAGDAAQDYLHLAVQLCQAVGARAILLALADSDSQTLSLMELIEKRLGDLSRYCDYDSLAGNHSSASVVRIAQWRGCQLLLTRKCCRPRWLSWFQGDDRGFTSAPTQGLALIEMNSFPASNECLT